MLQYMLFQLFEKARVVLIVALEIAEFYHLRFTGCSTNTIKLDADGP